MSKDGALTLISRGMNLVSLSKEAQNSLFAAMQKLVESEFVGDFCSIYSKYADRSKDFVYKTAFAEMSEISKNVGIHRFEGNALLLFAMLDGLEKRYESADISKEIFLNTIVDLRYKVDESWEVFSVYGITDACAVGWYPSIFSVRVVGIGRLQYEYKKLGHACSIGGVDLKEETMVLNIHIPRTGTPLDRESVLASYADAAKFFADRFIGDSVIFCCKSWLLFPRHLEFLSPNANLRAFYLDFDIVDSGEYSDYSQVWRLFDREYNGDVDVLPQNTSLRRAYADLIRRGEPTGWGMGVKIYQKQ